MIEARENKGRIILECGIVLCGCLMKGQQFTIDEGIRSLPMGIDVPV